MVNNELKNAGFTETDGQIGCKSGLEGQFADLLNIGNLFEKRQKDINSAIQTLKHQRQSIDTQIGALESAGHKLTQLMSNCSSLSTAPTLDGKMKQAIATIRPENLNYLVTFQPENDNLDLSQAADKTSPVSLDELMQNLSALSTENALLCILGHFGRPVPKSIWMEHMLDAGKKPPTIEVARSKLHINKMIKGHYGTYAITAAGRAHLLSVWEA